MYNISQLPVVDTFLDLPTLCFIIGIIILSLLSLLFIFHLRLKSRNSVHLQNFNTLWSVRLLLVSFVSLWAFNELLRIPFFRRRYLDKVFPTLSLSQQAGLCKVHVILSLGFYEPGFLVTLLFLLSVSIKKISKPHNTCSVIIIFSLCLPIFFLQIFVVYFHPFRLPLPDVFHQTSIDVQDSEGNHMVLCSYPLCSTIIFTLFGAAYCIWFLCSCCKVLSIVINKSLRARICALAITVLTTLPLQILLLGVSAWWNPNDVVHGCLTMVIFLNAMSCAAVGEGILVIRPIADALIAEAGKCYQLERQQQEQMLIQHEATEEEEESNSHPLVLEVVYKD